MAQPIFHFQSENVDLYKGEHFPVWAADLGRAGWYGFPATSDVTVKLSNHGPGREVHPDDKRETTSEDEVWCRNFLTDNLPSLAEVPLANSRTCLYCDSWDANFYMDGFSYVGEISSFGAKDSHGIWGYPSSPVLTGAQGEVIMLLADARRVIAAAEKKAAEIGQPMNIAVADCGGNLIAHVRMDNAWIGSIDISIQKAYTSRAFDISTKDLAAHSQSGGQFFGIHASNNGRIMIFAGGIPLKRSGKVVGAIGVSGGSGDQDHAVAEAGAVAF